MMFIFLCCVIVSAQEQVLVQFSPDFLELIQAHHQNYARTMIITKQQPIEAKEKTLVMSVCAKVRAAVVLYALYASGVNAYQLHRNLNASECNIAQLLGMQNVTAYVGFGFEMTKVIVLLVCSNYLYKLFIIDK